MKENLEFHSYQIDTEDYLDDNDELKTEILLWSFNEKSEPLLARVKDFPIFCKVELPVFIDRSGSIIKWEQETVQDLIKAIKRKLESKEVEEPLSIKLIKAQKLYYYTGNKKYPFLFMTFNTISHMHIVKKICKYIYMDNSKLELKFLETDVDIYNKMFSCQNCSTTDKITCKGEIIDVEDERRISKGGNKIRPFKEYIVDWKSIKKSDNDWFSTPIIMSFDIETYSHNHRCFPQKHYHEDVIFSISMTIQVFMKPETRKDIVIIIGPTQKVDGVEIIYAKDEFDVLEKFCEIVQKEDPDVFIGYNIFGFDYDYMNTRLEDVGLEWSNIGRLVEKGCGMDELSWNSSAYGFQKLKIFNCPGRISVDMLPYIKRDYKLPLYNLSAVGKFFLGDEKYDLKAYEMFAIHKKVMRQIKVLNEITKSEDYLESVKILKENHSKYEKNDVKKILDAISKNTLIVKYNVQDTLLVTRLFEKLNVWIALIESSSIFRVTPMILFTRGQQKRCVSQLYHFASHQNYVLTTRENVWQYAVGGYVGEPVVGFHDPVVCYDFNSLYPSIIIANNLCYTTMLRSIIDVDTSIYKRFDVVQNEPLDPKPKMNDDFDYDGFYEKEEPESKEKIERKYQFGFVKPEVKKGLLPTILSDLLGNRKKVKKERKIIDKQVDIIDKYILALYKEKEDSLVSDIKNDKAKELFKVFFDCKEEDRLGKYIEGLTKKFFAMKVNSDILDSRQLSLKVSANSMYGFTLAQTMGKLPIVEIGMTITYEGRRMIIEAGLYFEKNYGVKVVYGDSIPGYEPVLLKNQHGGIFIEEIENLVEESRWIPYEGFKVGESNRSEKSQAFVNLYSWSKGKWNKIVRIIKHRTNKNIYRITASDSNVEVTEDHSLLNSQWKKLKPSELEIGKTKLAFSLPKAEENMIINSLNTRKNLAKNYYNTSLCERVASSKCQRLDRNDNNVVSKIELVHRNYTDYVYDIETENGFFQAGIGEINIKNTDSTMVHIPGDKSFEEKYQMALEMEKDINGYPDVKDEEGNIIKKGKESLFPPPLNLELEKVMRVLYMKKKYYVYTEYDGKGEIIKQKNSELEELHYKGILLARRDNCQWVRNIYEKLVRNRFRYGTIKEAFKIIIEGIIELIEMKDLKDFTKNLSTVKSMGSNYKNKSYPLSIFSEVAKEAGRPVNPGERFPFVIVKDYLDREKVGYKMRTNELFIEQWETSGYQYGDKIPTDFESNIGLFPPEEIDLYRYIDNSLREPVDNLFNYSYLDIIEKYNDYTYIPKYNSHLRKVSVKTPVKLVVLLIKDTTKLLQGTKLEPCKEIIEDLHKLIDWFDKIEIN